MKRIEHGFELLKTVEIGELRTRARLFRHVATGAELLSLENDDENKVFGITFRTPPSDSTGVAHILEHSVLCGSSRYPVKEPFVELLKGSLQTFLNAFTFPDKTCYPVASQNLRDFYNLVDVYMDAALNPLITPATHAQEAWHLAVEKTGDPLAFKGVVFNEMKGVYSSPDSVLVQYAQESLFPDTTYGLDSGGHPEHIPDLTHEQLVAFHRRFYHPSNARIFFHGDDDPAERLRVMSEWLKPYKRLDVDSGVPLQPSFTAPRKLARAFHSSGAEEPRGMAVTSWMLGEATDPEGYIAAEILAHALVGTPSSPLRKALIESGLGEDLAGVGLENQLRQMYFSTGLKGVRPADADRVEGLLLATVEALAAGGIDRRTIEASLSTIEFRLRENNSGNYPRGLSLMIRCLASWLYGGDPVAHLAFEEPLARIKAASAKGYFEGMLRRCFVENPHRSTLVLMPDPSVGPAAEAREKQRLAEAREGMSDADIAGLVARTRDLMQRQITPDPPEALAKLPKLALGDLPRVNKSIPREEMEFADTRGLHHDLFTQGIVYIDLGFNLRALPDRLLPYAPLWGRALLEMGTEKGDFVSLDQRIGSSTGGIEPALFTLSGRQPEDDAAWMFLRGKALEDKVGALADILGDVLLTPRFDLRDRFRQIVLEQKASTESSLVPAGSSFVNYRLRGGASFADSVAERARGISHLLFVRDLARKIDSEWEFVLSDLRDFHACVAARKFMVVNVTCASSALDATREALMPVLSGIAHESSGPASVAAMNGGDDEGFVIPAQVNYVGLGARLPAPGRRLRGSDLLVARYIRSSYLWERVRVQGGAYGSNCLLDPRSRYVTFTSYRDPHLERTLETYRAIPAYLGALQLDGDELTKAVVGTIGDFDQHLLPDAKGYTDLGRWLIGETPDIRQAMREEVLATTAADFHDFGDRLAEAMRSPRVAVLGSEASIQRSPQLKSSRLL